MSILTCPVCACALTAQAHTYVCANGHAFDLAKEGYLNLLLPTQRRSRFPGDAPELCRARRAFLAKGYYAPLRAFVAERLQGEVVLDACCGEGYYTSAFARSGRETYGFDIAKDMVRLASKADKRAFYFVAGLHSIPVRPQSVDTLTHLFAPFEDAQFARVLKTGGTLVTVQPGERHLWQLKKALYETPYPGRETPPQTILTLRTEERLRYEIDLRGPEDALNLFRMTPYSYKTARGGEEKLRVMDSFCITADFVVRTYRKDQT